MDNKDSIEIKKTLKENINLIIRGYRVIAKSFTKPVFKSKAIASVFEALSPFVNFYFSALILNELVGDKRKGVLIQLVLLTIVLNFLVLFLKSLITRWKNYCEANEYALTWGIYSDKLLSMDYADVEDPKIQQQVSEIQQHQNGMGFGLSELIYKFEDFIKSICMVVLSITIAMSLFSTNVPEGSEYAFLDSNTATLTCVFAMGLSIFLVPYLNLIGGKVWQKASEVNNVGNRLYWFYTNLVMESFNGKDIRIYNQEISLSKQNDFNKDFAYFVEYQAKWETMSSIVMNISSSYIYLFVAMKAYAGAFGVGSIVLYVGAITQLTQGFSGLISVAGGLIKNNVFLEPVINFLEIENKKYQGTLSVEKREDNEYQIEFKNVSFKYPKTDIYALKNVNMKLHIGQKVAIVGMNGSGKTTMIKLLCRLYDVDEGVITLNGIDIKNTTMTSTWTYFLLCFKTLN